MSENVRASVATLFQVARELLAEVERLDDGAQRAAIEHGAVECIRAGLALEDAFRVRSPIRPWGESRLVHDDKKEGNPC